MKTKILGLALGMFTAGVLLFSSCQKETEGVGSATPNGQKVTITETGTGCTPIYAGQNILAGEVCMADVDTNNDGIKDALRVTYSTSGGWLLYEIHFAVGNSTTCIPMTRKGNMIPGQFPYNYGNLGGVTTYTFDVPFTSSCFNYVCGNASPFYAAAHCVVGIPGGATETGWGNGSYTPGNSWGEIFSFSIDCNDDQDPPTKCETAFAYNQNGTNGTNRYCFLDLSDAGSYNPNGTPSQNMNRWGWTNRISEGTYSFQVWAGAGQCNLSSGTQVGTLNVVYSAGTATVTYTTIAGFTMDEVHLYVGGAILPLNNGNYTVAPGQYPLTYDLNSASSAGPYTFSGLTGDVYVVAHAVVCGPYPAN